MGHIDVSYSLNFRQCALHNPIQRSSENENTKRKQLKKSADDIDSDLKFPRIDKLLTQGVLAERIKDWCNKLIVEKIDPWQFFGIVDVKITKYDGTLIHCGKGLVFEGAPVHVFWNFIEPFLKKRDR